jgi:hypothetical protein
LHRHPPKPPEDCNTTATTTATTKGHQRFFGQDENCFDTNHLFENSTASALAMNTSLIGREAYYLLVWTVLLFF